MEAPLAQLPSSLLRFADLPTRKATGFELIPTAEQRKAIAQLLNIVAVKKLRFTGDLAPQGRKDWTLNASLGATVVQSCVVSLDPVTTRIDENVSRRYMSDIAEIEAAEIEMPEDDTIDPLPDSLDVAQVMIEALSLALPAYPRVPGADITQVNFSAPGAAPMTDEQAKPFAGLSSLKEALEKKDK
ncbi:Uncharacterized metal-binding protein YceD, DUF177 family [Yoonia tamlensis]|uniref:Uncharacterized metal-binding protein YceD, DUF177 family n=1 Tax=Yoonia tamlensis TaxID=390270 RepID=A0A1I6GFP4_9RHOB|nr:DUF177 domain-containing protein [Yoonia tamlensis]SFR40999.1 Uncharacterized metal-binding protein YceD, DUF177 family [Yoonia tamlensis]